MAAHAGLLLRPYSIEQASLHGSANANAPASLVNVAALASLKLDMHVFKNASILHPYASADYHICLLSNQKHLVIVCVSRLSNTYTVGSYTSCLSSYLYSLCQKIK